MVFLINANKRIDKWIEKKKKKSLVWPRPPPTERIAKLIKEKKKESHQARALFLQRRTLFSVPGGGGTGSLSDGMGEGLGTGAGLGVGPSSFPASTSTITVFSPVLLPRLLLLSLILPPPLALACGLSGSASARSATTSRSSGSFEQDRTQAWTCSSVRRYTMSKVARRPSLPRRAAAPAAVAPMRYWGNRLCSARPGSSLRTI